MSRHSTTLFLLTLGIGLLVPPNSQGQATDSEGPDEEALLSLFSTSPSTLHGLGGRDGCTGKCKQLGQDGCEGPCYSCCTVEEEDPDCEGVVFCVYCATCESNENQTPTPDGSVDTYVPPQLWQQLMALVTETSPSGPEVFRAPCSGAITARWYPEPLAQRLRRKSSVIRL